MNNDFADRALVAELTEAINGDGWESSEQAERLCRESRDTIQRFGAALRVLAATDEDLAIIALMALGHTPTLDTPTEPE